MNDTYVITDIQSGIGRATMSSTSYGGREEKREGGRKGGSEGGKVITWYHHNQEVEKEREQESYQ